MTKRSRIYSANLGINVGAHLSFLVVITWCVTTLGHDQRCACGLRQDNNTHKIQYIPSIVVTNRHSVVIAAEPSVITLLVNISTCNYDWKRLNESAFPAHLYLSWYYIFRDHTVVNFAVDLSQEGVFIDRVHPIDPTKTYNFNGSTLVSSAADKITAKYGILFPKTLHFLTEKQLRLATDLPHSDPIILCACITKSLIPGKSFFFGYEYPLLTAAIASWHRLCGKRYLNMNQNSQLQYSTIT